MLVRKLAPGSRLGAQQLAELFGVGSTRIREALTRLVTRGIVTVSARRGWYLIEPNQEDERDAFEARRVLELGRLGHAQRPSQDAIRKLRQNVEREHASLKDQDVATRGFLLGNFHICLCESFGNTLLADSLRDLTTRTTLTTMQYQSSHHAKQSYGKHIGIVAALELAPLSGSAAQLHKPLFISHIPNYVVFVVTWLATFFSKKIFCLA